MAKLEADVAYFDARLSLLKDGPASRYQEAQIKAYRELGILLTGRLSRLSRQRPALVDGYSGRIEVEEILSEGRAEGDAVDSD